MTEFTHLNKEETRKIKNEKIKEEKYLSTDDDSKNKKLKESKVKKNRYLYFYFNNNINNII